MSYHGNSAHMSDCPSFRAAFWETVAFMVWCQYESMTEGHLSLKSPWPDFFKSNQSLFFINIQSIKMTIFLWHMGSRRYIKITIDIKEIHVIYLSNNLSIYIYITFSPPLAYPGLFHWHTPANTCIMFKTRVHPHAHTHAHTHATCVAHAHVRAHTHMRALHHLKH